MTLWKKTKKKIHFIIEEANYYLIYTHVSLSIFMTFSYIKSNFIYTVSLVELLGTGGRWNIVNGFKTTKRRRKKDKTILSQQLTTAKKRQLSPFTTAKRIKILWFQNEFMQIFNESEMMWIRTRSKISFLADNFICSHRPETCMSESKLPRLRLGGVPPENERSSLIHHVNAAILPFLFYTLYIIPESLLTKLETLSRKWSLPPIFQHAATKMMQSEWIVLLLELSVC